MPGCTTPQWTATVAGYRAADMPAIPIGNVDGGQKRADAGWDFVIRPRTAMACDAQAYTPGTRRRSALEAVARSVLATPGAATERPTTDPALARAGAVRQAARTGLESAVLLLKTAD